jgi:hypothetical protein
MPDWRPCRADLKQCQWFRRLTISSWGWNNPVISGQKSAIALWQRCRAVRRLTFDAPVTKQLRRKSAGSMGADTEQYEESEPPSPI